jgi:hypothetical protein
VSRFPRRFDRFTRPAMADSARRASGGRSGHWTGSSPRTRTPGDRDRLPPSSPSETTGRATRSASRSVARRPRSSDGTGLTSPWRVQRGRWTTSSQSVQRSRDALPVSVLRAPGFHAGQRRHLSGVLLARRHRATEVGPTGREAPIGPRSSKPKRTSPGAAPSSSGCRTTHDRRAVTSLWTPTGRHSIRTVTS